MLPPRPAEFAARIAGDVAGRVDEDFADLRPGLETAVQTSGHSHPLMEAERLATEAIRDRWSTLQEACERALEDVHDAYLAQAACVHEADDDLRERGVESWIAGAVIHQHAFSLAWDVLDELDLVAEPSEAVE